MTAQQTRSVWVAVVLTLTGATCPLRVGAADPVFSRYRTVTLGDSVPAVVEALNAACPTSGRSRSDRTWFSSSTWRPQRYVSGAAVDLDPIDEMILTFHLGRLARIAGSYDRNRTEGLTDTDLTDAFTGVYGPPMLPSTSSHTPTPNAKPAAASVIGLWGDAQTLVTLWREGYRQQLRFTIATLVADAAMREALADGVALAASEAPGKELDRRTVDAAALQARAEKIRSDNKASFKP